MYNPSHFFLPEKVEQKSSRLAQRLRLPSLAHARQHPTAFCIIHLVRSKKHEFFLQPTFSNTHVVVNYSKTNVCCSIPLDSSYSTMLHETHAGQGAQLLRTFYFCFLPSHSLHDKLFQTPMPLFMFVGQTTAACKPLRKK